MNIKITVDTCMHGKLVYKVEKLEDKLFAVDMQANYPALTLQF